MSSYTARELPAPPDPRDLLSASGPRTLVGFDFDGTLVDLAPRPDLIHYSPECFTSLKKVAEESPPGAQVILCSGRSVEDLGRFVPQTMNLVGSHGLEWRVNGESSQWVTMEWWGWRKLHEAEILRAIHDFGGELEDKRVSLTLHFRSAPGFWATPEGENWVRGIAGANVGIMPGTLCWNFVGYGRAPGMGSAVQMTKGESLIRYAVEHQFERVIYFGDEQTDETVFERTELPVFGIQVTTEDGKVHHEKATAARYQLRGISKVHEWLKKLAAL